jgi:two-component system, NarL family, response regulator DegU
LPIRVVIADDQILTRLGLKAILESERDIEVVGEAENGREALEKAVALSPDLVLLDIMMPGGDGIEAARAIKQRRPDTEILILTVHGNQDLFRRAAMAGASGYVLKDIPPANLVNAIRDIHGGRTMIYPAIARRMMGGSLTSKGMPALTAAGQRYALTERNLDVLLGVALGLSDKEIASKLLLSKSTVKTHLRSIYHKLKIRNRTEAAAFVMAQNLLPKSLV